MKQDFVGNRNNEKVLLKSFFKRISFWRFQYKKHIHQQYKTSTPTKKVIKIAKNFEKQTQSSDLEKYLELQHYSELLHLYTKTLSQNSESLTNALIDTESEQTGFTPIKKFSSSPHSCQTLC